MWVYIAIKNRDAILAWVFRIIHPEFILRVIETRRLNVYWVSGE